MEYRDIVRGYVVRKIPGVCRYCKFLNECNDGFYCGIAAGEISINDYYEKSCQHTFPMRMRKIKVAVGKGNY